MKYVNFILMMFLWKKCSKYPSLETKNNKVLENEKKKKKKKKKGL
jgi:hypothetical protein